MSSQKLKQIVIWGKGFGMDGQDTLIFKNCSVKHEGEHILEFTYMGLKTGVTSTAVFHVKDIAGHAIGDMPDKLQESK